MLNDKYLLNKKLIVPLFLKGDKRGIQKPEITAKCIEYSSWNRYVKNIIEKNRSANFYEEVILTF
jgi:hypothetical protein